MTHSPDLPTGRVVQINVNPQGGVPKYAVPSAEIQINGVIGDKQRHRRFHGGPSRAVSLYSYELIQVLQAAGHRLAPGSLGENLTLSGLDWGSLRIGTQLRIGDQVWLEIASYAAPCSQLASAFQSGEFKRISQKAHPGWSRLYARVRTEGVVQVGEKVILLG